jgi:membrane protein YdbS with pleckstrin-like domain
MQLSERIHPNAIPAWRLQFSLSGLLLFVPPVILYLIHYNDVIRIEWSIATGLIAVLLYSLGLLFWPKLRWSRWSYEVTDKGIQMRRGIFWVKHTEVPINRIQHVDTAQGPIYRYYQLAVVRLSNAATSHEIPALSVEVSEHVKNQITEMVRTAKEDV